MGIVVVHRKLPGDGGFHQNGRAADVVLPEHIPVGNVLLYRKHIACELSLRGHQLPGGGADYRLLLPDSLQLEPQFSLRPVIVCIQEGHILPPGQGNTPVPGLGHPQVFLVSHIANPGLLPVSGHQPRQVIGGAIVHHNHLQRHLLPQGRVDGLGNIGCAVVGRNDHADKIFSKFVHLST